MNVSKFSRYTLGICAALAVLAGCGGSHGQSVTPTVPQEGRSPQERSVLNRAKNSPGFTVKGRDILLNGKRFFIKGLDYGPTNAGYTYYNNQGVLVVDAPVANPLDNAYKEIWKPDLDLMRADGVNAIKVYNVSLDQFKGVPGYNDATFQHPSKGETGKIDEFLDAAWNNGNHPIYVMLSIYFEGKALTPGSTVKKTYVDFYRMMDKEYGAKPAVMGISISSEINAADYVRSADWWNAFNAIDAAAKEGFAQAGNANRITTTTFVDGTTRSDSGETVEEAPYFGTKFKSTNDTWGLDVYRGPHIARAHFFDEVRGATTKPMLLGEYGNPAAWFYESTAKHGPQGHCIDYPDGDPGTPEDVDELLDKASANPGMHNLVDYATQNQQDLFDNYNSPESVNSGGFYFEFSDEWWKAGWARQHIGGYHGKIPRNAQYATCYNSEAWFGLYIDKPVNAKVDDHGNLEDQPFPNGRKPDARVPRTPLLNALTALWKAE